MGLEILVSVGSFVTGGFVESFAAGVIGGALVGAAVGGLTSAVFGGDIGKGLLYGAVGGAVYGTAAGAINTLSFSEAAVSTGLESTSTSLGGSITQSSPYASAASETFGVSATALEPAAVTAEYAPMASQGIKFAASTGYTPGATSTLGFTTSALPEMPAGFAVSEGASGVGGMLSNLSFKSLEDVGAYVGVSALSSGVQGYLGMEAAEKSAEATTKANKEAMKTQLEIQKMRGEQELESIAAQKTTLSEADKLAYQARMAELKQREEEFTKTSDFQREQYEATRADRTKRQALFGAENKRGVTVTNTPMSSGIYDYLQGKEDEDEDEGAYKTLTHMV